MNIVFSEDLKSYLQRKNYHAIEISIAESRTCCSGSCELALIPLTDRAAEISRGKAVRVIDAPEAQLLVMDRGLEYDEDVSLGLRNFLGVKDVTVEGIRAYSLS